MGVGKGTVARELIQNADMIGVDSDDLIVSMENRSIKNIFAHEGEEYFRKLERKVAKWLEQSVKDAIISTGGGFYKVPNLKKIGTIVYLYSDFDSLYKRIIEHPNAQNKLKKRPLFKDVQKAEELFDQRAPKYRELADITIDVREKTPQQIVKEILKKVKK